MAGKKSVKNHPKPSPQKKKSNPKNTLYTILAVIIALSFIVFSIYQPGRSKKNSSNNKSELIGKTNIPFRNDGVLTISSPDGISSVKVNIEKVDKEDTRMRGLMWRASLPSDAGMLFIFPEEEERAFWMKNTYIPLDIIYINKDKEIISIQMNTKPLSEDAIPSEKPAEYVLEVNAGFTLKNGIKAGDRVEF